MAEMMVSKDGRQPVLMDIPLPSSIEAGLAEIDLAATDVKMGRVVEDLIDLLEAKGVIVFEDLPPSAQDRIAARKIARGKL